MPRTRTLIIALALAVALPAALAHLTGCERTPDDPLYDNPFDPESPEGGDGLQVRAGFNSNVINISWDHHSGRDIVAYALDHRTDQETAWTTLLDTLLDRDDVASVGYLHYFPTPNRTHYYQVQAVTSDGKFSITGYATPATLGVPPLVFTGLKNKKIPSRYLDLKIVSGEGDSIRVADNPAFAGAIVVPAAAPEDSAYATWDYGLHATEDTFRIYVQSFSSDGYASEMFNSRLTVTFEPTVGILGGAGTTGTIKTPHVINDLLIDSRGVEQMRFALDEAGLTGATWVPGSDVFEDFVLQGIPSIQSIWCEFQGDFGFNFVREVKVQGDLLNAAGFKLKLPSNRVTTHTLVSVTSTAAADSMKFADSPDFTGVPWLRFDSPHMVEFNGVPGTVTIYGQFKNDWNDSDVFTDSLIFSLLPLDIFFVNPTDGAEVEGGTSMEITGRALGADGVLPLSIEVDKGDGLGFSTVSNKMDWTTDWTVPMVTEATEVVLRARTTTETDIATAAITVTIVPPAE